MKSPKLRPWLAGVAILLTSVVTAGAAGADPAPKKTDKQILEDAGYDCDRISAGGYECNNEIDGDKSQYLCTNEGKCEHWKGPKNSEFRPPRSSWRDRPRYEGPTEASRS